MITLYREEQVEGISLKLNIPKAVVKKMITGYIDYLNSQIRIGKTIKFLNLFYMVVSGYIDTQETLAYTAHKVGEDYEISPIVAYSILEKYQEMIIEDLNSGFSYNIRGLANLSVKDFGDRKSVSAKKSTVYNGYDIRISQTRYLRNCLKEH